MPELYITCPKTGLPTPTYVSVNKDEFESGQGPRISNMGARCIHCGKDHDWDAKVAFLLPEKIKFHLPQKT